MCFRNHQNLYWKQAILKQKMYQRKTPMPSTRYRDTQVFHLPPFCWATFARVVSCVVSTKVPKDFDSSGGVTNYPSTNFRCTPSTLWQRVENNLQWKKMEALGDGACLRFLTWLQWFWMWWNQQQTCCKKWNMLLDSQSLCRKQLKQLPHRWTNLWRKHLTTGTKYAWIVFKYWSRVSCRTWYKNIAVTIISFPKLFPNALSDSPISKPVWLLSRFHKLSTCLFNFTTVKVKFEMAPNFFPKKNVGCKHVHPVFTTKKLCSSKDISKKSQAFQRLCRNYLDVRDVMLLLPCLVGWGKG